MCNMRSKTLKLARTSTRFVIAGVAATLATSANAASTATVNAVAEVLNSITVSADTNLDFGQIAAPSSSTITVNTDSSVSSTGAVVSHGVPASASFTVTGSPNAMVLVTVPVSPISLTRSGGTETMTLSGLHTGLNSAFQLDEVRGQATFKVGGTLTLESNQASGAYSGTFEISVEYQ